MISLDITRKEIQEKYITTQKIRTASSEAVFSHLFLMLILGEKKIVL